MNSQLHAKFILNLAGNLDRTTNRWARSAEQFQSRYGRAIGIARRSTVGFSNTLDRAANRYSAFLTGAGAVAFKRQFIDLTTELQRQEKVLAGLEGSAEAGADAIAFVKEIARNAPFDVGQLTQAYIKLRAFGIDPTTGALQAVIDQTSALAGDSEVLNAIILQLGQAFILGKLQMEDIRPLLERGVDVFGLLSEATGIQVDKMGDLISQGYFGRKAILALIEAMAGKNAGAAQDQMKTLFGLISNGADSWREFRSEILKGGLGEFMTSELQAVMDLVEQAQADGSFETTANEVAQTLIETLTAAKEIGVGLADVMKVVGGVFKEMADLAGGYDNLIKFAAGAFAVNKAARAGGAVYQGTKGLLGRGGTPANPLFVSNVNDLIAGKKKSDRNVFGGKNKTAKDALKRQNRFGSLKATGKLAGALTGVGAAVLAGYGIGDELFGAKNRKKTALDNAIAQLMGSGATGPDLLLKQQALANAKSGLNGHAKPFPNGTLRVVVEDDRVRFTEVPEGVEAARSIGSTTGVL